VNIDNFLYDRRSLALKLKDVKLSPARTILINILLSSNLNILQAITDKWFKLKYGVKPLGSTLYIPICLLPKYDDSDEFFNWLSNNLKKSIK
jgi:hypothetical protein